MLAWLANFAASGILKAFGDTVVTPLLQAYLKSKDVDAQKYVATEAGVEQLAAAVLDANVKFAQIQSTYALSVLQWWPFRLILFVTLLFCASRFCLIVTDATLPKILGYAPWDIDPLKGVYGSAELQYLTLFVIAKPVDTAVSGMVALASRYLSRG